MRKVKVFCFLLVTIFFLTSKIYSQEIEFEDHTIVGDDVVAQNVYFVFAADVDSDGDMDVLSTSMYDDTIAWYENDGDEFFNVHVITTNAALAKSVYAIDLDDDGDMDVLSASYGTPIFNGEIAWYENDGDENFIDHVITASEDEFYSVYAVDVDNDGDIDVLSASSYYSNIAWYENDGDENFNAHTITTNVYGAWSVYAVDVDNDGDIDILSASFSDDKIAWYENDGDENFSTHIITTSADGASSVYAADVDSDGDMNVLSASWFDNKIGWYENLQITGINDENNLILMSNDLKNYPNPFNPTTTISFSIPEESKVELTVYNIKGQKVKILSDNNYDKGNHSVSWDGVDESGKPISSGIYFYKLNVNGKSESVKKCLLLK